MDFDASLLDPSDPIVAIADVTLTDDAHDAIYMWQYPLRPAARPYANDGETAIGKVEKVRMKPQQKLFEVEMPVDELSQHFDHQSSVARENLKLLSHRVPDRANYALGAFREGKLVLTPTAALCQLRPTFKYLDELDHKKKTQDDALKEAAEGAKPKKKAAAEATNSSRAAEPQQVLQRMKKTSSYQKKRTTESFAQYHRRMGEEKWVDFKYIPKHERPAATEYNRISLGSYRELSNTLSNSDFLDRINPEAIKEVNIPDIDPLVSESERPAVAKVIKAGMAVPAIRRLQPHTQALAVLRNAHVITFTELFSMLRPANNNTKHNIYLGLTVFGCCLRGVWLIRSRYTSYSGRAQAARDYLITMFWEDIENGSRGEVSKAEWLKVARLPVHTANEIIEEIADLDKTIPDHPIWRLKSIESAGAYAKFMREFPRLADQDDYREMMVKNSLEHLYGKEAKERDPDFAPWMRAKAQMTNSAPGI